MTTLRTAVAAGAAFAALGTTAVLLAQMTAGSQRIVFTEVTRLGEAGQAIEPPVKLPVELVGSSYSGDSALRTLVSALRTTVAAAGGLDEDGAAGYLYTTIPLGRLWHNPGRGGSQLRDLTRSSRIAAPSEAILSAAFSDYDKSGRQSLFFVGATGIRLYRNNGNHTFLDVTREAGLESKPGDVYTNLTAGDLDGDGFPDLLVTVYTNSNRSPAKPRFTFPNDFAGAGSRLYRNNGNGTFTDATDAAGLGKNPGRGRKAIFADLNGDKMPDILLLRDDKPPALYLNRGGWKFTEGTWDAGDDLTSHAFFEGAVADFNGDGKPDLALWSTVSFRVLLNRGNARFERAKSAPMIAPFAGLSGFHGTVADLDGDGVADIVTADQDRHLQALLATQGGFREIGISLPSSFAGGFLEPVRLRGFAGPHFVAVEPGGRIALLAATAK